MSDLIISSPNRQTRPQRLASTFVTLVFWVFWFYLWLPLLTLAGWLMGIDTVYFQMVESSGYRSLVDLLGEFSSVVATLGIVLAGWAVYNFIRFKDAERRRPQKVVSDYELCIFFRISQRILTACRNSSFVAVQFSDAGEIIEMLPVPWPSAISRPFDPVGTSELEITI